jgi:hypothetical protein
LTKRTPYWDTANNWNFGGAGALNGLTPGAPHAVEISPTRSATIYGSANANVQSLTLSGNVNQLVTLNLNGGSTATTDYQGTTLYNAALTGNGQLVGHLTVSGGSRVNVNAGESMQLTGGWVLNSGDVKVWGTAANLARLEVGSWFNNYLGGKINLQNANVSLLGGLENYGQMNVTFGTDNVDGTLSNHTGGQIILSGNSNTTFWNPVNLEAGSELRVSSGSNAVFFGDVYEHTGSILTGTGTKTFEGLLSIGNSPGLLFDQGSVTLGAGSVYQAEIAGLTPGDAVNGFDKYVVGGNLAFAGTLKLMWYGNFGAQAGDVFDLFDWGSSDGSFSKIDTRFAQLGTGLNWDFSKLYTSGEIGVAAVPLPGAMPLMLSALGVLGFMGRRANNGKPFQV